jgi:hypothetical protein
MCDPVTLTVLTIAATVVTAGAQVYSGVAAKEQGKFEQTVANRNAQLAEAQAQDANERRNIDQMRLWRRVSQQLGEQRAEAGAQGLDVNFGSVADLQTDTLMIGMEDSSTLNQNTIKEMKGYDIEASNDRLQGLAARTRGNAAMTSSLFQATGTLLSGATQVAKLNLGPQATP